MALEPPSTFPRTQVSAWCCGGNGSWGKCQAYFRSLESFPKPFGILISGFLSLGPASSSSTLRDGSDDSRLASGQPADPAPTTM